MNTMNEQEQIAQLRAELALAKQQTAAIEAKAAREKAAIEAKAAREKAAIEAKIAPEKAAIEAKTAAFGAFAHLRETALILNSFCNRLPRRTVDSSATQQSSTAAAKRSAYDTIDDHVFVALADVDINNNEAATVDTDEEEMSDDETTIIEHNDVDFLPKLPRSMDEKVQEAFASWLEAHDGLWPSALSYLRDKRGKPKSINEIADVQRVSHSLVNCVVSAVVDALENAEDVRQKLALYLEMKASATSALRTETFTAVKEDCKNENGKICVVPARPKNLEQCPDGALFLRCNQECYAAHAASRAIVAFEWKNKCTTTNVRKALVGLTADFAATIAAFPRVVRSMFGLFGDGLRFHGVKHQLSSKPQQYDQIATRAHRLTMAKNGSWNTEESRDTVTMIGSVVLAALDAHQLISPPPAVNTSNTLWWLRPDDSVFELHDLNGVLVARFFVTELLSVTGSVKVFRAKLQCVSTSSDKFEPHSMLANKTGRAEMLNEKTIDVVWKLRGDLICSEETLDRYSNEISKLKIVDNFDTQRHNIVQLVFNLGAYGMLLSWCGVSVQRLIKQPRYDWPVALCACSDQQLTELSFVIAQRGASLISYLHSKGFAWNDIHQQNVLLWCENDIVSVYFADAESLTPIWGNDNDAGHHNHNDNANNNDSTQRTPAPSVYRHENSSPPKLLVDTKAYDWFCLLYLLDWMLSKTRSDSLSNNEREKVMDRCLPHWRSVDWSEFEIVPSTLFDNLFGFYHKTLLWKAFVERNKIEL